MGLLDDAIREHLDLKRRRGADPAEVARLEHEALGPVRREPAQADAEPAQTAESAQPDPHPASEGLHPEEHTHVLAPEDRHEPPHGDALLGGAAAEEHGEAEAATEPEPRAEHADRAGGGEDARPPAEGPVGAHPEPTGPARQAAETNTVDQPTTEYRVEDHHTDEHAAAPEAASEDVLEETPDFLQETPEHDRLWFEQRPPRDFDFDG